MIFTDRTVIVQKGTSSINDTIVLYRGDKDVEIRFTLNEGSPFRFGSGTSSNIIEKTEATYGQLVIKTPGALPPIFSEVMPTIGGKIIFTITAEMIDEITEVGNYAFQIRLLDENKGSRATLPEVKNGIEIREPIASEDTTNEVGVATVGYAMTTAGTPEDAFDSQGNYNKTTWGTGDRITDAKLSKIENGIYDAHNKINVINNKVEENTTNTNTAKQDINDIKLQIGTEELTTTSKKIKGAINELGSQIKDIINQSEFNLNMQNVLYNDNCEILEENNNYLFTCEFYELTSNIIKFETTSSNFTNFHGLIYDENYSLLTKINALDNIITIDTSSLSKEPKYARICIQLNTANDDIKIKCLEGLKNKKTDNIDYIVASKDANDEIKENADMVCKGVDDAVALRHAMFISYYLGKQLILSNGDFILDSTINYETNVPAKKTCLWYPHYITPEQFDLPSRFFTLKGNTTPIAYRNGTRLIVSQNLYDSLGTNSELSVIRGQYQTSSDVFSGGVSFIELKNLIIYIPGNQKKITAIDLGYSYGCILDNINCTTLDPTKGYGYHKAPPMPVEGCYGILGVMGSNWNTLNTFKNVECMGFYVGFDVSGEHCLVENASMKYNYYGFTFNKFQKLQGAHHHPITCINLLDEHSMSMPMFNAGLYYITGYNLMFPHSVTFEGVSCYDSRHKLAQNSKSNAYGYIYYNCNTTKSGGIHSENCVFPKFFMTGHGKNMKCYNGAHKSACSTSERLSYEANYMQQVYDTNLKQLFIYNGTEWVECSSSSSSSDIDYTNLEILDGGIINYEASKLNLVEGCKSYKVSCKPNTVYKISRSKITTRFNVGFTETSDIVYLNYAESGKCTDVKNIVYEDATNTDLECFIKTNDKATNIIIWFSRNGEQSDLDAKITVEEVKMEQLTYSNDVRGILLNDMFVRSETNTIEVAENSKCYAFPCTKNNFYKITRTELTERWNICYSSSTGVGSICSDFLYTDAISSIDLESYFYAPSDGYIILWFTRYSLEDDLSITITCKSNK